MYAKAAHLHDVVDRVARCTQCDSCAAAARSALYDDESKEPPPDPRDEELAKLRAYEERTRDTVCWGVECVHEAQALTMLASGMEERDRLVEQNWAMGAALESLHTSASEDTLKASLSATMAALQTTVDAMQGMLDEEFTSASDAPTMQMVLGRCRAAMAVVKNLTKKQGDG